jgi:spore germination protein YaaH
MHKTLVLLLLAAALAPARPKALFYLTREADSVQSFLAHASRVDILVPTWYSVDAAGAVSGAPDETVLDAARRAHVPVMPIVANPESNQEAIHKLMADPEAGRRMIQALIRESKQHGYTGFQFDFEDIIATDRDLLSGLVRAAAAALHREGLQLSIATVPNAPARPGTGAFSRWIYANWRDVYDLQALASSVDLLCLMTYDEHTRYTPPGPVAGYAWTLENLEYALRFVPKEKLSLGIPLYGYRWFAGDPGKEGKPNITSVTVKYPDLREILDGFHPEIQWDSADRNSWFWFYRDATREYVFFTDVRTFRERWNLANERGLEGFCSWVLGAEDPAIWDVLPER